MQNNSNTSMTPEEIKDILEAHSLCIEGRGGNLADLRHADLEGSNLQGANLEGANLENM